jgi:hypothetical protein
LKRRCETPRNDPLLKLPLEVGVVTGSFPTKPRLPARNVSGNHALLRSQALR